MIEEQGKNQAPDAKRPIHERVVSLHNYRSQSGCLICGKCGTAKHKLNYEGFKYWFAGVGYKQEPPCRDAN